MFKEKQAALEQHVKDNFSIAFLAYENTPAPNPDLVDEWARVAVLWGDSNRMQLGQPGAYRHPGLLAVQIFLKEGIGVDRAVALADAVSAALRDQVVSGINLLVPRVQKSTVVDKGWFQLQVATPFYFDEVT